MNAERQVAKRPRKNAKEMRGFKMPFDDEDPPFVEPDLELDAMAHEVIGAALEVHRRLGPGLDEAIYCAAMQIEMTFRRIPFTREVMINVFYRDAQVGTKRLDFVVGGRLIVEVKAVEQLHPLHKAQVNTYLKITGHKLALLINFNTGLLKEGIKRIIRR